MAEFHRRSGGPSQPVKAVTRPWPHFGPGVGARKTFMRNLSWSWKGLAVEGPCHCGWQWLKRRSQGPGENSLNLLAAGGRQMGPKGDSSACTDEEQLYRGR